MAPPENVSDPPTSIDPYAVLSVPSTATAAEIRSAYKKLALRLHPDKAAPADRDTAHTAFQSLAFAYAVLSEPARRARYDRTGSTSEALDLDDGDFDWADFFRAQYAELITTDKINNIKSSYQNSAEERKDVLEAYKKGKGSLDKVFQDVMLSSVLDDEERFRSYIDEGIADGTVEALDKYTKETEGKKASRRKRAMRERDEAEQEAKRLGVHEKIFGKGKAEGADEADEKTGGARGKAKPKKKAASSEMDLAAMIQQRNAGRANTLIEALEAKYAGGGKGKKRRMDEPSEEDFAAMAKRGKKGKENDAGDPEWEDLESPKKSKTSRAKKAGNRKA